MGGNGPPPSTTGQSLTAQPMPAGGPPADAQGPQIFGPQNSTIPPGKQVGPFRNPFTDASTLDPSQLKGAGSGFNLPALLRSNPILAGLYATMYSTPAETGEAPRQTLGRKPSGPQPTQWPDSTNYPQYAPYTPGIGQGPFAGRPAAPPGSPNGQPLGSNAPVTNRPQDRPSYAGSAVAPSAVAAQKPNLGYYMMDRPNMPAAGNARGGGGPPGMGVFGFDPQGPFLGRGPPAGPLAAAVNPAAAPQPAPAPVPMPVPRPVTNRPQDRPSYAGARIGPGGAY